MIFTIQLYYKLFVIRYIECIRSLHRNGGFKVQLHRGVEFDFKFHSVELWHINSEGARVGRL
jgi:hypothetical protein